MTNKWGAIVELWPYNGIAQDQTGPRAVRMIVGAADMREAMEAVDIFLAGLRTNPNVWRAPVISLTQSHDPNDRIGDCKPYDCEAPSPTGPLRAARKTVAALSGMGG